MKFHALDRNYNGKETLLQGWDSFLSAVFVLVTTPYGSIPEIPTAGFDMIELFGYEEHDQHYEDLCTEFKEKIAALENSIPVDIQIQRYDEDKTIIDIKITYTSPNDQIYNEVIRNKLEDGKVLTYFKDIRLR
jgi:hypothetical protein